MKLLAYLRFQWTKDNLMSYKEIYRKSDELRAKSKLSQEDTERIIGAYERASISNYEISLKNQYGIDVHPRKSTIIRHKSVTDRILEWLGIERAEREFTVCNMRAGDVGYTMPWMIDNGNPRAGATLTDKGGTASVRVECIRQSVYSIQYEEPVYWGD